MPEDRESLVKTVGTKSELHDRADKEIEMILKQLEPLRVKESALQKKVDEENAKLTEVRKKIVAIEQPRLTLATLVVAAESTPRAGRTLERHERYEQAKKDFEALEPLGE